MVILLFLITFLFLTAIIFYLIKQIRKLNFSANKTLSWLITIFLIAIIFLFFNLVNSLVIILHLSIFISLTQLILSITKKLSKKDFNPKLNVIIGIFITIIYLGIGYYLDYHIYETKYDITTKKDLGQDNFRILQIADSHIGTTLNGQKFSKVIDKLNKTNPDLVVITGDFVDDDTSKEDLLISCEALSKLKSKHGVYFVYGNHDKGYFDYRDFKDEDLRKELKKSNVTILEDEVKELTDKIYLIGRKDKSSLNRASIESLTKDLDKNRFMIVLNHQPNDYKNETSAKVDLVLSGHTHGGQLFPLGNIGLLIGANDRFYGIERRDNTTFIVNTGLSDWAIDFKTGTKSEYVIIDIKKE